MPIFLVQLARSGPEWDPTLRLEAQSRWAPHARFMDELVEQGFIILGGPLADERRVVHVVHAASEEAIRETLSRDPWFQSHLQIDAVDPWTIRLDGRHTAPATLIG